MCRDIVDRLRDTELLLAESRAREARLNHLVDLAIRDSEDHPDGPFLSAEFWSALERA